MTTTTDQLQRLAEAGFTLQTFERYPRALGAVREECVALLDVTPAGLKLIGTPGWRMGEVLGVLVKRGGRQVFQAKSHMIEATPERLGALNRFCADLNQALVPTI